MVERNRKPIEMLQRFDVQCQVLPSLNMTPSSSSDCSAEKCNLLSCHSFCRERVEEEGRRKEKRRGVTDKEKSEKYEKKGEL